MAQLYAACRLDGVLEIRHVQLTADLAETVELIFGIQENAFIEGIDEIIPFNGDWKPDPDELLVIAGLGEAQQLLDAADQNAIALQPLDIAEFAALNIVALYIASGAAADRRLLVQYFSPQQVLSRGIALFHQNDVFRRLVEPAFSLDTKIAAIIGADASVRFKSFAILRRIFNVTPIFQEATTPELHVFCASAALHVADPAAFVANADEGIRKSVLAISRSGVLANNAVAHIQQIAQTMQFEIDVIDGRIAIPTERRDIKTLFSFLLNRVYRGPIDQQLLIANSHRVLAQ